MVSFSVGAHQVVYILWENEDYPKPVTGLDCHVAPDRADVEKNRVAEPEGERLRAELEAWLKKNKIVGIMMDTTEHVIRVDIVKLPRRTKSALTVWGSIRVRDDREE